MVTERGKMDTEIFSKIEIVSPHILRSKVLMMDTIWIVRDGSFIGDNLDQTYSDLFVVRDKVEDELVSLGFITSRT